MKWPHHTTLAQVLVAATAKSLQLCPTLCDPIDSSPPGFHVPGILQARTPERVLVILPNLLCGLLVDALKSPPLRTPFSLRAEERACAFVSLWESSQGASGHTSLSIGVAFGRTD